jgi:hypothetical protein
MSVSIACSLGRRPLQTVTLKGNLHIADPKTAETALLLVLIPDPGLVAGLLLPLVLMADLHTLTVMTGDTVVAITTGPSPLLDTVTGTID